MPDVNGARAPPIGAGEDLILIASGTRLVIQGTPQSVGPAGATARAGVWARGDILLNIGDNVYAPVDTAIVAGSTITIYGDFGNADPGVGTLMQLGGRIGGVFDLSTPTLNTIRSWIFGNVDDDRFELDSTFLGAPTRVYGSATQTPGATAGLDVFVVTTLQTMDVARGDTLTLDGQGEHDEYLVITTGTQVPTPSDERNYVINVLDTGVERQRQPVHLGR